MDLGTPIISEVRIDMFLVKNDLASIKSYFQQQLPSFSKSEIDLMVKLLTCKRLIINENDYFLSKDILFSESDLLYFRNVVKRMQRNEPFQYILGEVEFYGVLLKIDERALIPRPETEELVDWIVDSLPNDSYFSVVDLCAGSGCISFSLSSRYRNGRVTSVEYSAEAVKLIEENKQFTGLDVDVLEFDVLDKKAFPFQINSFDCWVSNPPYIPEKDKDFMHPNVLEYEPEMALFVSNDDPLIFYREIAENAKLYLKEGGWLYFEIHEELGDETIALLQNLNFVNIEMRKDLQGKNRMIRAQKSTLVA